MASTIISEPPNEEELKIQKEMEEINNEIQEIDNTLEIHNRDILKMKYEIETLAIDYKESSNSKKLEYQEKKLSKPQEPFNPKNICVSENACFKCQEIDTFEGITINYFSKILHNEIQLYNTYIVEACEERARYLRYIYDIIKNACTNNISNFCMLQSGSLFTNLLMPWSDLNITISLSQSKKHTMSVDSLMENYLEVLRNIEEFVFDYKIIKNPLYNQMQVIG